MASKFNFEFELSEKSIKELIKNFGNLEKELKNARGYILEALTNYTKERVQYYISYSVGVGGYPSTGKLMDSIKIQKISEDMASVYTDLAYAKYVEFGTGIVGKSNPNPKAGEFGWSYDTNDHGEKGWVYTASDGNVYWTQGEEAHNFMYNAWVDLKENHLSIARQVLKERGII